MDLTQNNIAGRRIGLLADTHGNLSALRRAVEGLLEQGAQSLIHLGDFCDSVHQDHLEQTFELLQAYPIRVIKGNNDYQVEKMLENGYMQENSEKKRQWLTFLKKAPIIYRSESICFSHSMPFNSIRALYDPMDTGDTDQAQKAFDNSDYRLIFCGHSHSPIMFRQAMGHVSRETIREGAVIAFKPAERYIVIVGAADNAECGIFDIEDATYRRIRIS